MLLLLPALTFLLAFVSLLGYERSIAEKPDWRNSFLQTCVVMAGYLVISSEILSLNNSLNSFWVSVSWAMALIVTTIIGWTKGWLTAGMRTFRAAIHKPGWFDLIAGISLATIYFLLLVVALKSPTNNNDSLLYHMSRVAHWQQNASLHHYPTQFIAQLVHPIGAELTILQLSLLWGNFGLANLVQWMAAVGTMIGVTVISKHFGANKHGQWLAAAFIASLPIGILQATSTQNDYVTAFWFITLLYLAFSINPGVCSIFDIVLVGLALGMGMATKTSFFPYGFPVVIYLIVKFWKILGIKKGFLNLALIALCAICLNLGIWGRNYSSFGSPLGPKEFVSGLSSSKIAPARLLTGPVLNIIQNFATPEDTLNEKIVLGIKRTFAAFDPGINNFSILWAWNHEDLAGNPLHIILILASIVILIIKRKHIKTVGAWIYFGVISSAFVLFSILVRYDVYGVRYQIPIFSSFAPLVAISIELLHRRGLSRSLTILLILACLPWTLFNRTRPLIAMRPSNDPYTIPCYAGCTTGSILSEPQVNTLFAVWADRKDSYIQSMELVKSTGCENIGLKLDSSDLEYAYWWLLGAPRPGLRIESVETTPQLQRYLDPTFKPCVVICTTCGKDQSELYELDLIGEFQNIQIYGTEQ